jgi:membrane associated rhomboid family serine protease
MRYEADHGPPLFTFAALAAFIAFFGAEYQHFDLSRFYAFPWRVADGQWWRLITSTFLHGGFMHIAFNVLLFLRFSTVIDNWLGPWFAMIFYAFLAASTSAAELLVSPIGGIGASGVVYGLFGFLWVMSRRRDDAAEAANVQIIQTMLGWLAVCAVINYFGGNIGNTAHGMGLLLGWLVGQTFVARRKWRIPMALATLVVWAIPLVFIQRPVWDRTLAHVAPFNQWYPHHLSDERRQIYEDPENAPDVGLFSNRRRH